MIRLPVSHLRQATQVRPKANLHGIFAHAIPIHLHKVLMATLIILVEALIRRLLVAKSCWVATDHDLASNCSGLGCCKLHLIVGIESR